ncbi:MAG TPA: SusC/RagA family TonB-linked outer membrane protein [Gemmatimonadaceae bacterium]|nr:SusC/RagA family TonB-linked outer membrane protein [Gemmatimonadaceae bacterium]
MISLKRIGRLSAGLMLVAAFATAASAQSQAVITGRVTDAQGNGVPGANVVIPSLGLGVGANTNVEGNYTITIGSSNVGRSAVVTARRIGFAPVSRTITITTGSQTQNFELAQDARRIEDVVVTGVAEATSTKNLTISVGKVGEAQLKEVPAISPATALAGKVSGVRVSFTQGQPGSSPAIRVRTSTNLGVGTQDPLVIVDGVVSKNGLADINGNDIESIEVLKGAASANTYGSAAASGVIAVTTKRGRDAPEGKVSFLTRNEFGTSEVERLVPLLQTHPFQLNADGSFVINASGSRVLETDHYADNPFPAGTWRNQLSENLQTGRNVTNYAQISLRKGNTNFSTSLSRDTDRGILPLLKGFRRSNVRLNLDQGLGDKADLSASLTYGLSFSDQTPASRAGSGSTFFTLLQSPPDVDLQYPNGTPGCNADAGECGTKYSPVLPAAAAGGTARGNPLLDLAQRSYNDRRERIIGAFSGRYRPFSWLTFEGSYGTDRLNRRESNFLDRGLVGTNTVTESESQGTLAINTENNQASVSQLNATLNFNLGQLHSTTRLTYSYEDERNNYFGIGFSRLAVASVPDVQAGDPTAYTATGDGTIPPSGSFIQNLRTMNGFVTQNFNYGDRYLLQLLGRRDGSSLFGAANRWNNFYGFSGAWRVTQDFNIPGVQELKLRAARGTAGLRPGFEYQYETYALTSGTLSKNTIGNKNLKPAVQTENEFGVNASFLDRFDLEFVKSDRHTDGAFLLVPLSLAQAGGFTAQWQNAARIGGRTHEMSLNTRVFERPNFSYNFTLTAERSRQKIDELNRAAFRVGSVSQNQNIFFYREGEALGVIYGQRWARSIAELADNPLNAGKDLNALYEINDDGYVVAKGTRGTIGERAIAYVDPTGSNNVKIGDVNPDYSFGFANTIRLGGFTLYGLLDGTRGGNIYNFTKQWMFQDQRHAELDQAGKTPENKKAIEYYTVGFYNALEPNSHFVEDGSYVKLRELSVSYNFGQSLLNTMRFLGQGRTVKVALIGRNLKTWTDYSGFDPESSSNGDFNFRIDGFRYPSFRQITGQIEIGF